MIKSISLKNYKCFKDLEIDNFGDLNLLVGKNNVGKTSFLEVLVFLLKFPIISFSSLVNRGYLFQQGEIIDADDIWGSAFYLRSRDPILFKYVNENNTNELCVRWNYNTSIAGDPNFSLFMNTYNSAPKQPVDGAPPRFLDFEKNVIRNGSKISDKTDWQEALYNNMLSPILRINLTNDSKLQDNTENRPVVYYISSQIPLGSYINIKNLFEKLVVQNEEKTLYEFLKIIDPNIESLIPYKNTFLVQLKDSTRVSLSHMGDGVHKAFLFYLSIANSRNGIVCIDEIENGIHYSVMGDLFSYIRKISKKYNCQIFASTHSYDCIKAVREGYKDNLSEIRFIRFNTFSKEVIATTYSSEGFAEAIDKEDEVRG